MHINHLGFNVGRGNFGDFINRLFWQSLCQKEFITSFDVNKEYHFATTGSVMEWVTDKAIIFGTGFISKDSDLGGGKWEIKSNKKHCTPHSIYSVRGEMTRNKLIKMGVPCPESYGDPLLLFPAIYNPQSDNTSNIIGVIPHYNDYNSLEVDLLMKDLLNKDLPVRKINIITHNNYLKFINEIISCDTIISSSLHGVIMGLLYNKKTIFKTFSNNVWGGTFKFYDFFSSLCIEYNHLVDNEHLLDNHICLDKNKLLELQHKMIEICPLFTKDIKDKVFKMMNF